MKLLACLVLLASLGAADGAGAQDRVTLGWGRLFTNDVIGDGEDRWRTGSYAVSKLTGLRWGGDLPDKPGQILEYSFTADAIAPANLLSPAAADRRYAGALSFGVATYFDAAGFDAMLGSGLTVVGPQTGIGVVQSALHEILGMDIPTTVLDDQIPNQIIPYAKAEFARSFNLADRVVARPFASVQIGAEDVVRVGGDLILGRFGEKDLLLRDTSTGQLYRGIAGDAQTQFSFVIGADHAQVFRSVFLPPGGAAVLKPGRDRLRAGYLWHGKAASIFSGLTYLSPEFNGQVEGQIVGSLTLSFGF